VAAAVAQATLAGARVLQKPQTYDWGTFAVLLDPDSNRVGLYEPPTTPTSTEEQA
jgi:predicted enzyme related to lactoylglutathione lyase